jgi:AcrR family transcriptional regulator
VATRAEIRETTEARRQQLVAVAIEAVRDEGPGVGMVEIARRAGVTKPAIYHYFGSKHGLYQAVADWFVGEMLVEIEELVGRHLPLRDVIAGTIDLVLRRISEDRAIYQFLMRRARMELSSAARDADHDYLRQLGEAVASLLTGRLDRAGLDVAPAPIIAHGVVGMINSVGDWWLDHPEVPRAEVVATLTFAIYDGFGTLER